LSQQEAFSSAEALLLFIGHESPLQHDIAVEAAPIVLVYATAAIDSPKTINAAIAIIIFVFIFITPIFRNQILSPGPIMALGTD
jgi:hypothetical protein